MKYKSGQECLVLHSVSRPDLIGTTIILGEWSSPDSVQYMPHGYWWTAAPATLNLNGSTTIFAESWLMPLTGLNLHESEIFEEEMADAR